MNKTVRITAPDGPRALLSTLWIAVLINILSADVFSFMLGASGEAAVSVTPWIMFAFAVVNELPIAMIVLSRILKRKANRILNYVAAGVTALYIVAGGSATPHYIFFALVELICLVFVVMIAKKWQEAT